MDRGDIWHVDLNPTKGREEANPSYVLILTEHDFNVLNTPIVAPITGSGNFARVQCFTVSLSGAGTNASGVILCRQLRALDLRARNARFSEKAPAFIVDEVLAKATACLSRKPRHGGQALLNRIDRKRGDMFLRADFD